MEQDEGIPESVQNAIFTFHDNITKLEDSLEPFLSKSLEDTEKNLEPLNKARIELMSIFAANSLYWMYLCTRGESPSEHPILDELKRVKKYMDRLKELEDRKKAPKLDKRAAKSFVRNALWEPTYDQTMDNNGEINDTVANGHNTDFPEPSTSQLADELNEVLRQLKDASNAKVTARQDETVQETESVAVNSLNKTRKRTKKNDTKAKKVSRVDEDIHNG